MSWSCPFYSRQNVSPDWGPSSIPRDLRSPTRVHLIYVETWQPRSGDCLRFQGLAPYRWLSRTVWPALFGHSVLSRASWYQTAWVSYPWPHFPVDNFFYRIVEDLFMQANSHNNKVLFLGTITSIFTELTG